jgi:hypothetical protein
MSDKKIVNYDSSESTWKLGLVMAKLPDEWLTKTVIFTPRKKRNETESMSELKQLLLNYKKKEVDNLKREEEIKLKEEEIKLKEEEIKLKEEEFLKREDEYLKLEEEYISYCRELIDENILLRQFLHINRENYEK